MVVVVDALVFLAVVVVAVGGVVGSFFGVVVLVCVCCCCCSCSCCSCSCCRRVFFILTSLL